MSKNSAAQKVQEAEAPKMTVVKPQEEKKAEVINKAKAEDVSFSPVVQEIKPLTIEEIKRKSEVLSRLAVKYDQLQEKRKQVENFKLSHDKDSTLVRVFDSGGEVFESSSPKTIGRLLDFWFEEFSEGLKETEKQMREIA